MIMDEGGADCITERGEDILGVVVTHNGIDVKEISGGTGEK